MPTMKPKPAWTTLDDAPDLLTIPETGFVMRTCDRTVRAEIASGELRECRFGRVQRVRKVDLIDLIDRRSRGTRDAGAEFGDLGTKAGNVQGLMCRSDPSNPNEDSGGGDGSAS